MITINSERAFVQHGFGKSLPHAGPMEVASGAWSGFHRAMATTLSRSGALLLCAALGIAACKPAKPATSSEGAPSSEPGPSAAPESSASAAPSTEPSATTATEPVGDAPEISRSEGKEGGVVVFWPRVVPRTDDPAIRELAAGLQKKLGELVAKAVPKRERDVRPEPERACPKTGCAAMTVGVVLTSKDKGCVAVALVARAGAEPSKLIAWAGTIELKSEEVAFRAPAESMITVTDMVPCAKLLETAAKSDAAVIKAIKEAAGAK
jgi:hypothetical protein